jgi:hypothetical protein
MKKNKNDKSITRIMIKYEINKWTLTKATIKGEKTIIMKKKVLEGGKTKYKRKLLTAKQLDAFKKSVSYINRKTQERLKHLILMSKLSAVNQVLDPVGDMFNEIMTYGNVSGKFETLPHMKELEMEEWNNAAKKYIKPSKIDLAIQIHEKYKKAERYRRNEKMIEEAIKKDVFKKILYEGISNHFTKIRKEVWDSRLKNRYQNPVKPGIKEADIFSRCRMTKLSPSECGEVVEFVVDNTDNIPLPEKIPFPDDFLKVFKEVES